MINIGSGIAFNFFNAYALYFYEVEIGLPIFFFTMAYIIFAIWDAINDPLVGYLSDKTYGFTKKWGRRFPWIIFGSIPVTIFFLLVLAPPDVDPITNAPLIFIWLALFLCAYEWFYTASSINYTALFPQKFRTDRDRRYVTGFNILGWGMTQFLGIVLPPMIIQFGDKSSFFTAGLIIVLISLPFIVIGIPGCREDKQLIEQVLKCEEKSAKKDMFFDTMKKLLKNRNFLAMLFVWLMVNTYECLAIGSVIYFTRYVLQVEEIVASFILMGYLIACLIFIPIWIKIIGKLGEIKVGYVGVIGMGVAMIPVLIGQEIITTIISSIMIGTFVCAWQCADEPLFASVIDQVVIQEKRRTEGTYNGALRFILRLSAPFATIILVILHVSTGFDSSSPTQNPLAEWGIIAGFAIIPLILAFVGIAIFWKAWNITEEERLDLKKQLLQLDL